MINWNKPEEQLVGVKELVANVGELSLKISTRKTEHRYSRYSHNDSIQYLTQHTTGYLIISYFILFHLILSYFILKSCIKGAMQKKLYYES